MDIRANWNATPSAPTEAIERGPPPTVEDKVRVAIRQLGRVHGADRTEYIIEQRRRSDGGLGKFLDELLNDLCVALECRRTELRLDHNPALALRKYDPVAKLFTPDANDPYFLRYITDEHHQRKTHVSGDGAQRSDTAERMHRRRLDENRGLRPKKKSRPIQSRGFDTGPRANKKWWGSRKFPKRKFAQ